MQSGWANPVHYIHRPTSSLDINDEKLSLHSITKIAFKSKDQDAFIFHAQSSLPYLLTFYLITRAIIRKPKIVYDIHDLHEKEYFSDILKYIRYRLFRYRILHLMEALSLKIVNRRMTVSDGLADTISKRYKTSPPKLVLNANPNGSSRPENKTLKDKRPLVFFGTSGRFPFQLIDTLENEEIELDVWGRGMSSQWLFENTKKHYKNIKFFGEFSPNDLSFLKNYEALLLYYPDGRSDNYIYSLPNKFFQALDNGLSLLISNNFLEIKHQLDCILGSYAVIKEKTKIRDSLELVRESRPKNYQTLCKNHLEKLKNDSRDQFYSCIN